MPLMAEFVLNVEEVRFGMLTSAWGSVRWWRRWRSRRWPADAAPVESRRLFTCCSRRRGFLDFWLTAVISLRGIGVADFYTTINTTFR